MPTSPESKYLEDLDIADLAHVPDRLIEFGTLFGTKRLQLGHLEHVTIRRNIRQHMAFKNEVMTVIADRIRDLLGGDKGYVSVHLRLGDGFFATKGRQNARDVWWRTVHQVLGISVEQAYLLESSILSTPVARLDPHPPFTKDLHGLVPDNATNSSRPCRSALHSNVHLLPLNVPLFVATDVMTPSQHPALLLFRNSFPCTLFLSDFQPELVSLESLINVNDGVALRPFMIPFVDSMVAAKGRQVVGTLGSTFSRFVTDVLWRVYHDLPILERGVRTGR